MSTPISVDRVYGNYPVSIATSLALEGLLHTGEYADWKGEPPIHKYQALFLNVRTLFRNAFNAFEINREKLTAEVLITSIEEDISGIMAAAKAAAPSMLCVPYLCLYKSANKKFPEAAFKNAYDPARATPSMLFFAALEHDVYKLIADQQMFGVTLFDTDIEGDHDTLVLTHYPADLLCRKKFPKLGLLESHTGKVKTHLEWYTKLNGKPDKVPFAKWSLVLFGDGTMFSPLDRKVRAVVLKTAEKYNWDQTTTSDRISTNLRLMNEPFAIEFIRRLDR